MTTVAYATLAELEDFLGTENTAPTDAVRQLLRATELIDATVRIPFTVGTDDLPTDPDIADCLRDATCAVVEAWLEVGEANDIDGLAGTQVSVPGYSGGRAPTLPPRAARLLRNLGMVSPVPVVSQ